MKLRKVFGGVGLVVLLLLDRRSGSRSRGVARAEGPSGSELDHWTFNREFITAAIIVGMSAALWLPMFRREGLTPLLSQQASVFISLTSSIILTVVSIGAVLVVLPYGSSKNRTDTAAALVVFAVLTIVSGIALYLYSDYRTLLDFCEGLGEAPRARYCQQPFQGQVNRNYRVMSSPYTKHAESLQTWSGSQPSVAWAS